MAPNLSTPLINCETSSDCESDQLKGDEIVISGISGAFPKSDNVMEFMENLYNKTDMVEEVDFATIKHPNLPKHYGKMRNSSKFDAQFFRVTHWQASSLDPMSRKVMEQAYGAIFDSGINPLTLSGSKLGVFIGSSYSDAVAINLYDLQTKNSFIISGCSKTMASNRISYWIDGKGPSMVLDQACTSSMACLELACQSIKRGDCDAALVGGCNYCVHPILSLNLKKEGYLSSDGKTKCFDKNGDGYVRSDAVNLIFLQKAKDAKRIYAEIHHIKGKYFTTPDANFLPVRKSKDIETFLDEFYSEIKVSPSEVEYVEAFGMGLSTADSQELEAIGNFFAESKVMKVGSVKSNMGNAEAANGMCGLTKLCLAYHKGELPANLHYEEPLDIPVIKNGAVQVLTKNTQFNRKFTAMNIFSSTGTNFHVLLKGHHKKLNKYSSNIPYLILLSGREEQGMSKVMDVLKSQPIDPEQIALLHNIHNYNFPGHTGRCYTILDKDKNGDTVCLAKHFDTYPGNIRPICFLYSGMGSQWNGMGTKLMRIPIFAAAIERCQKVLEPVGVDLIEIITSPDETIFDSILNSMVGISAIQIALTDVLTAIGVVPDIIIGHSIGELGCAYADGCFTAEEMIMSAYYRGLVSIQTPFIKGSMAAVGLGYNEILPLCPLEIEVACHNSAASATLSGPADVMEKFITDLVSRGIFCRKVASSNIAYHSKYISHAGPKLLSAMQKFIPEPKMRSNKWISTSVPIENWDKINAKYASSEYFSNNLLNPVYFEENASLIPNDAVVIEIAPHGLLQAIVKRSHKECINIPLTKRGCSDPVSFMLESIGRLFQAGVNPKIDGLYPKVKFPVSAETPPITHLIQWEHSIDWPDAAYKSKTFKDTASRNIVISVHDDEYQFMKGHKRNGTIEVPEAVFLVFAWETLAMYKGKSYKDMSVNFSGVTFHNRMKIETEDVIRFRIAIQIGSNHFEMSSGNLLICSGFIKEILKENLVKCGGGTDDPDVYLSSDNIYTLLERKGHSYGEDFKSIHSLSANCDKAYIKKAEEWMTFLDSLLQLKVITANHDGVSVPKLINELTINIMRHRNEDCIAKDNAICHIAKILKFEDSIRCGGVDLKGITMDDIPVLKEIADSILLQKFIPHVNEANIDLTTAIFINLQLVMENMMSDIINVLEISSSNEPIITNMDVILNKITKHHFIHDTINIDNLKIQDINVTNLFIIPNLNNIKILKTLSENMNGDSFILSFEDTIFNIIEDYYPNLVIVTRMSIGHQQILLLKPKALYYTKNVVYIPIDFDSKFTWLSRVQCELQKTRRVVLVSDKQPYSGLIGFTKHLMKTYRDKIGLVVIDDYTTSPFDPNNEVYEVQLRKNLCVNVLKKGQWGNYYYTPDIHKTKIENLILTCTTFQDLDRFHWLEKPQPINNIIQVSHAGISSEDTQKATGKSKDDNLSFGMDYSGVNSRGQQVMGLIAHGALSNTVEADLNMLWPVPHHWTLEDAVTVPLPYVHAYYCLVIRGQIKGGQSVLVTSGLAGLSQAVISICLSLCCDIFTTVDDENEKKILLNLFPQLKEQNVICCNDESFFTTLKSITNNERCDIVIDSNNGKLKHAAMKCVAFIGKFLDVSSADMYENKNFEMFYLEEDRTYMAIDISSIFKPENLNDRKRLQYLVAEGITNGTVRPLIRIVFQPDSVSRAFKLLASKINRGRALIRMEEWSSLSTPNVVPRITYSEGVYVIISDKCNLGVELTDHLIRRGVKTIMLHLKPNHVKDYLYFKSKSWKKFDITIEVNMENLRTMDGCKSLIKAAEKLGAVTGIFIVQDYENKIEDEDIEPDNLKNSFDETSAVTANLDIISRNSNTLRYFVFVSTATLNLSSEHATSICERICESRNETGFPGLVLRTNIPIVRKQTTISRLCNTMDRSLKLNHSNVTVCYNHSTSLDQSHIDERLQKLLGLKSIKDLDGHRPLNDINLNDAVTDELQKELGPRVISPEELQSMSIFRLKELYRTSKCKSVDFQIGLRAFYKTVELNEFNAINDFIPMKTQLPSVDDSGHFDNTGTYMMMIPGFEGHHSILTSIAERLKIRAVTLQLGPNVMSENIPEMAEILANHVKPNFEMTTKFYIFGYSFGVNVALELARIWEAEGRRGVVYCLDSSPDALKTQIKAYLGEKTDSELQNCVLEHMFNLMTGVKCQAVKQDLECMDTWTNKIKYIMERLQGLVHFSIEHRKTILESAYNRIKMALEYEPDFKLESKLVLMKGIPHPAAENLCEDYNLSKFSTKPVHVYALKYDHPLVPYDLRVSNILNKMLDPTILEDFNKVNLCEHYYL